MGMIPVYNVASDFGAIGDGNPANANTNTNAFINAINAINGSGGPGILYVPNYYPTPKGFVVNNGSITISQPNVILQGNGGMGNSGTGSGTGSSTIIAQGNGDTITITGNAMGCAVRDLAFAPNGAQNGSYLRISQTGQGGSQAQITVSNVHMSSPYIGITLEQATNGGNYWIELLLIEGTIAVGGINANVALASVNLRHVIMHNSYSNQPQYGIQVKNAGELVICDGTDIDAMGIGWK